MTRAMISALALLLATPALAAKQLPMCYVVVATDAGNPQAVLEHENYHCWGWIHPENKPGNQTINSQYRAYIAPLKYRMKGWYPKDRIEIRFELSKDVLKLCNSAYGCQSGGLRGE